MLFFRKSTACATEHCPALQSSVPRIWFLSVSVIFGESLSSADPLPPEDFAPSDLLPDAPDFLSAALSLVFFDLLLSAAACPVTVISISGVLTSAGSV